MRLVLQPLEGADLFHWVGTPSVRCVPDSPTLGLPRNGLPRLGFHVALTTGVNAHRSAIMRPSPLRTIAMAASRLCFKSTKTSASRAANTAA